jgi:hypothetical protein
MVLQSPHFPVAHPLLRSQSSKRFVLRPVSPDLTAEVVFNDSKQVLEFMLTRP